MSDESLAALILTGADPETARLLAGLSGAIGGRGFIRAIVTASREPISVTVRAIQSGIASASNQLPTRKKSTTNSRCRVDEAVAGLADQTWALPSNRFIVDAIAQLSEFAPVLLIIDEFGEEPRSIR
ncbi:MAG: hypothetical protein R2770_14915 [Acidimicrobiales bacterium]